MPCPMSYAPTLNLRKLILTLWSENWRFTIFRWRRRGALSAILSFPFISLFFTSFALPKQSPRVSWALKGLHSTHIQIPTSCVFCVPWLVALLRAPVKQRQVVRRNRAPEPTHPSGGEKKIHTHTGGDGYSKNTPVVCVPVVGSLPEPLFYPPCLRKKATFRDLCSFKVKLRLRCTHTACWGPSAFVTWDAPVGSSWAGGDTLELAHTFTEWQAWEDVYVLKKTKIKNERKILCWYIILLTSPLYQVAS